MLESSLVLAEVAVGSVGGAAALMAHAVRAPSSSFFGPSIHRLAQDGPVIALTFDDGPSESTPEILSILHDYGIAATFFQCGANVRRLPDLARQVSLAGHQIGNHSDTHRNFCFCSAGTITEDFRRAQATIERVIDCSPTLLRAPFGVRWWGFREAQRTLRLHGVMWTVMARDWKLSAPQVAARLLRGASNGAIFCLHDGRELQTKPDISATAEALRIAIPSLLERGFRFETVNSTLCQKS